MPEYNVKFSPSSSTDIGTFKLLELPPELCKVVESTVDNPLRLTIKGQPNEDAVLCTAEKTYALRSVVLSNSILVVAPHPAEHASDTIVVRDQLNEIVELVPSIPQLHKLDVLLRGMEYDDGEKDVDSEGEVDIAELPLRRRFTYEDAQAEIQASDVELDNGLRERHILNLSGQLRPIVPAHLTTILELLLNYLVSLSLSHQAVPVEELASVLADEHEIPRQVSTQVISWFGDVNEGMWAMNVDAVVKEVGLNILKQHKNDPIPVDEFISQWKTAIGDTFEASVSLALLLGNYLSSTSSTTYPLTTALTYFPASALPIDPASRFADLFMTRSRWRGEEIAPFLSDIAVDSKERDKFLLKFARATTDPQGVWYTARAQYNG